jgi:hypothetical protein
MKIAYSILLLLVMGANVALPAIGRLYEAKAQQMECSTDDTEEEKKNEREEKEKEVCVWKHHVSVESQGFIKPSKRAFFPDVARIRSQAYTFFPEMPPDAALAARTA